MRRSTPRIAAVVLAAGRGRRMGGATPKHLIAIGGRPMVLHVVQALRQSLAEKVVAVLRPDEIETRAALEAEGARVVYAESGEEGRAASIRAGVLAVGPEADGILFALADQPFLGPTDFDALIGRFGERPDAIVHASYAGERGSPVLFAARFREDLLRLRGPEGGREVLRRHAGDAIGVELDPEAGRDIDRPEDLQGAGSRKFPL
jgi:molybdenum cofactor cytidylyltransferase